MANDMVTVSDLEASLGCASAVAPLTLDAAVAAIRRYCRWHVAPQRTETFVVDGTGDSLRVPSLRLLTVVGVAERVDGSFGASTTAGITWSASGLVARPSGFCAGFGRWAAHVTHGYDVGDVPDVVMVVAQLAARMQRAIDASGASIAEEQVGEYRYRLADKAIVAPGSGVGMTSAEEAWLARHRLVVAP